MAYSWHAYNTQYSILRIVIVIVIVPTTYTLLHNTQEYDIAIYDIWYYSIIEGSSSSSSSSSSM